MGAFVVMFAVVDTVLIGALNGLKQVKLVAGASMASTIVEFLLFVGLTYTFGIWGGLFAMTAIYGSKLAVSSWVAFRSGLISPRALFGTFDRQTMREIWRFYPMLLAHSIALPLAQILVRNGTVRTLGLEEGGYLQAVWRLSDMYVGVITTALGFYFMAQFSSLTSEGERGHMLRRTIVAALGHHRVLRTGIYLLRDVIIAVVLTASFAPIRSCCRFSCSETCSRWWTIHSRWCWSPNGGLAATSRRRWVALRSMSHSVCCGGRHWARRRRPWPMRRAISS